MFDYNDILRYENFFFSEKEKVTVTVYYNSREWSEISEEERAAAKEKMLMQALSTLFEKHLIG